ncbi:MAG TPA: EAL domain-containing protein [Noviherbaspirillum sp.]|jgi:diguanylate cyclase (GGDEF)-like protein|uniref:two-component system response regulator n=1 Tax=Noviherbaspirillum sp. TaxID=1926288 RepID=UPI002DDD368F|nr:EAL domain-containing protein [Noviherbaspirillum sp.]HEV2609581.1 EAL domain-containing protein [Noviherbaspirillum sp.]
MPPSITSSDDELVFLDEGMPPVRAAERTVEEPWRVMIVDDDADVHSATVLALSNMPIQQKPLVFLHAYSAAEARDLLAREKEVAVILLDVVMEREDAGLQLVRHIREDLKQTEVRIILRTGQPGYAPEMDAIRDFDINDYKSKAELTRVKLYTAVTAAIRSYQQIRTINANRRGLDLIVRASTELMALHGLPDFAAGVLARSARLLGLKPDGVLCVLEEHGTTRRLFTIAAAGRYAALVRKPLNPRTHALLGDALCQALALRRNIHTPESAVLYLAGSANRSFAAYLHTSTPLNELEQRLLEVFCSNVAIGLDNVELVNRLHDFAFFDPLTKLPNRTGLKEALDTRLAGMDKACATLALVDIDHFAETNDALGHQFGDQLLLGVAARMQSRLGKKLTIGRVGGDTFGLIGDSDQVSPAVILGLFEEPFSIDNNDVQLSATIGLVKLADYAADTGTDALKDADIALKRAKLQQRSGHFYYSHSMGMDIRERVRMMHALRSAFQDRELFVVYQPQIDLASRKPVGAEALLRWKSKDGSCIPPDRFIPIAEYSGLIIELGEWVLREACMEQMRLQNLGLEDFRMSVNVSQVQFRHPHFLAMLRKALDDTGIKPALLELEITESIAMEEPDVLIRLLGQIKRLGVSIAIDDFGTGFSSLSHLQQLQADKLKIDRAFVNEIIQSARGSSIAEMVIQLGRNLGMTVIAEGVEHERQADKLAALGCPLAQGYLFARPMPRAQLIEWLQRRDAS